MVPEQYFAGPLDRVMYLLSVALINGLETAHVTALAQDAAEVFVPQGSFLIQPEEPAEAFYVVVEGRVALSRRGKRLPTCDAGDAVGFLHLLARAPGLAARAESDTFALRMDWDAHLDVCEQRFSIVEHHLRYLARRTIEEWREGLPLASISDITGSRALVPTDRPLDLVDRITALRSSRAFPSDSLDALAELARHVTEVRYEAETELWSTGDEARYMLQLCEGEVTGSAPGGRPRTAGAGDLLGLYGALGHSRRWHDARVTSAVVALRIEIDPCLDILEDHFDTARDFAGLLAAHLLDLIEEPS